MVLPTVKQSRVIIADQPPVKLWLRRLHSDPKPTNMTGISMPIVRLNKSFNFNNLGAFKFKTEICLKFSNIENIKG